MQSQVFGINFSSFFFFKFFFYYRFYALYCLLLQIYQMILKTHHSFYVLGRATVNTRSHPLFIQPFDIVCCWFRCTYEYYRSQRFSFHKIRRESYYILYYGVFDVSLCAYVYLGKEKRFNGQNHGKIKNVSSILWLIKF